MLFKDTSGPRNPYFLNLQTALKDEGFAGPVLVLDRDRLCRNIEQLCQDLPDQMGFRVVAKSLPVPNILQMVSEATGTHRYMTFNQKMLHQVAALDQQADQLVGKPLPVGAAAQFYSNISRAEANGAVHWLIDSEKRLADYAELARARSLKLYVALEIDVGLHRGGLEVGPELAAVLTRINTEPGMTLSGFMGYEVHLSKVPKRFGMRDKAFRRALNTYRDALTMAREISGAAGENLPLRNTGGSSTFCLYHDTTVANEVSAGSALVKPTDFDKDILSAYVPALFIATPALKVSGPLRMPFREGLDPLKRVLDPNLSRTVFIHGGYWKAKPEDPPGLRYNAGYGRSSNQEVMTGGTKTDLAVDDFVFLRPTQSEAVLLQFGDIVICEEGAIVDSWSPFTTSV